MHLKQAMCLPSAGVSVLIVLNIMCHAIVIPTYCLCAIKSHNSCWTTTCMKPHSVPRLLYARPLCSHTFMQSSYAPKHCGRTAVTFVGGAGFAAQLHCTCMLCQLRCTFMLCQLHCTCMLCQLHCTCMLCQLHNSSWMAD